MRRIAFALCATLAATTALAASQYVPNHVKYSDTGHQPATGRSGSASIEVLALIDAHGVAEVEIKAVAPGTLQHVQVRTDPHTANYMVNAPSFVAPLPNAGRGTAVTVTANVDGAGGARMGVVIVTTTVHLRPDLAVSPIVAPARTLRDMPVEISATVQERNGDVGARATCALRVDGEVVDRATNIWVDAGGSVDCVFMHAFDTAGIRQLEVAVEDVTPRDDDENNNRASGSIVVEGEIQPSWWSFYAAEGETWSELRARSIWGHTSESISHDWSSRVQINVQMTGTLLNMETTQLRYSEKTEGQTIYDLDPVPLALTPIHAFRQCGRMNEDGFEILVCQRFENDDWRYRSDDVATIAVRRSAADATYYSHDAAPEIDGNPAYDTEYYVAWSSGNQTRYGNTVEFELELNDGAQWLRLDPVLTFERMEDPYSETTRCWGGDPEPTWCQDQKYESWFKWASVFVNNQ